jgi:3-oxoacyl-[acyl-carrier protein] reductase
MDWNFKDKIALVTGGTRGIGKEIAKTLNNLGATVYITGTKESNTPKDIELIISDFSTEEGIKLFIKKLDDIGEIDILINNAGINIIKELSNVTLDDFNVINNVNLKAPYFAVKYVCNKMKGKGAKIVNISSIWGHISKEKRSLYSSTKTALLGMTRSMAIEFGPHNIIINCVSPGFTNTELTNQSLSKNEKNDLTSEIPLGRFAEVNDIAELVTFLVSDSNKYITGQNIIIDGGFTIK